MVEVAHGTTLAALVGLVVVDPFAGMRSAPDWSGWLDGQQRLDRVMSRVMPPLFQSALATAAGATVVAVTLTTNEPLNARLRDWRPLDAPPDDWRTVRAQWDRAPAMTARVSRRSVCQLRIRHQRLLLSSSPNPGESYLVYSKTLTSDTPCRDR